MRKNQMVCAVLTVLTLVEAAPGLASEALEGGKPRHKVKEIGELDENAPKEMGGKIQFIPTGKGRTQMRAQQRKERLARKAEARKQRKEERARLRSLRQGKHAAKHARQAHVRKEHKPRTHKVKVHKPKVHKAKAPHVKAHKVRAHHPGRKHKHRMK